MTVDEMKRILEGSVLTVATAQVTTIHGTMWQAELQRILSNDCYRGQPITYVLWVSTDVSHDGVITGMFNEVKEELWKIVEQHEEMRDAWRTG